jgi:hypothetical protein
MILPLAQMPARKHHSSIESPVSRRGPYQHSVPSYFHTPGNAIYQSMPGTFLHFLKILAVSFFKSFSFLP